MAEAKAATSIGRVGATLHQGVGLAYDRKGVHLSLSLTIPPPRVILQSVARTSRAVWRQLMYSLFPFNFPALLVVVACVIGAVNYAPQDSWLRSGWLAQLAWGIGHASLLQPLWLSDDHTYHLFVVTAWTASVCFFLLAMVRRLLLRMLLRSKAFLYQEHGKPVPLTLKAWFLALRLLTGRNPSLYSFQGVLPKLPVPPLKQTVTKYLKCASALHGDDSARYKEIEKQANDFLANEGPKLQRYLVLKSWLSTNYVTDWWEKYVYLKGRSPIMINSNYYVLDSGRVHISTVQTARAAAVTHGLLQFRHSVEEETLSPLLVAKLVPLCSNQYKRIFATTRIPGREADTLQHLAMGDTKHIVVTCCGSYYKLPVYSRNGELMHMFDMEKAFAMIKYDAMLRAESGAVDAVEAALPALTAGDRTRWAEVREDFLLESPRNRVSLTDIERAIFIVDLDMAQYELLDWTNRAKGLIHGTGVNRWFDKSFTIVVQANGKVGTNVEHSWADAPVPSHMLEVGMVIGEHHTQPYDETGHIRPPKGHTRTSLMEVMGNAVLPGSVGATPEAVAAWKDASKGKGGVAQEAVREKGGSEEEDCSTAAVDCTRNRFAPWSRLQWRLSRECESAVLAAKGAAEELIADFDLQVVPFSKYGKGFMKQCKVSPDAYAQMALQLAWKREQGEFANTYEASMTRLYREGRTETVRPVTHEAVDFVNAMDDAKVSAEEKLALLQAAAKVHVRSYQDCMAGQGIDRHMFALYVVSVGKEIDAPFIKDALSQPWRLSTSQQPQQQTSLWNLRDPKWYKYVSPGGGFGPVADDGYGVSYMMASETEMFFHISSKKSCGNTSSEGFKKSLFQALDDLHTILAPATGAGKKKGGAAPAPTPAPAVAADKEVEEEEKPRRRSNRRRK